MRWLCACCEDICHCNALLGRVGAILVVIVAAAACSVAAVASVRSSPSERALPDVVEVMAKATASRRSE